MTRDESSNSVTGQKTPATPPLKPAMILSSTPVSDSTLDDDLQVDFRPKQIIDEQNEISLDMLSPDEQSCLPKDEIRPKKTSKKWWILATFLILGLAFAEVILATSQVVTNNDWLGAGWLVVLFIFIAGLLTFVAKEVRALKRLKIQTDIRQNSADLFNTPAIGLGQEHCINIAKQLPTQYQYLVDDWHKSLESHYTNNEILSLFELKVLSPIDKIALGNIGKHASAAGVMIAVSPFALVDMLIVLWRNLVMINQISRFYGLKLGYWGRIALIKKIFRSMLYVGATELLSDAGNYALGVGLTGKISSRVAQGLGAGVLTSRIGLKALNECRPMPWLATKKPGLSTMTNKLLEDLTKLIK